MAKKIKLPADTNKRAKSVVDLATGQDKPTVSDSDTKSAAKLLGRKGGLKGGPARKAALTAKRRIEIAKLAAAARWAKKKESK